MIGHASVTLQLNRNKKKYCTGLHQKFVDLKLEFNLRTGSYWQMIGYILTCQVASDGCVWYK